MERGFLDRVRKSSKKEEEEERRFQAQLKEAMEKSLQEETSEPYVEDRPQMDQTIDQAKERFMGEVGASNTGNVFQALNESTGDGGGSPTCSSPTWSAPMWNAWASPSGDGWTA